MRRFHSTTLRFTVVTALVAVLLGTYVNTVNPPAARAVGGVWWVAPTGTAANPASSGSSCASPSFVGGTHTALQSAIDAAIDGEEIHVCPGVYAIGSALTVDKGLTFTGDTPRETVLDGGGSNRIIDITTGNVTVTLDRLHVTNGKVTSGTEAGGGVRVHEDATLHVMDSIFTNNRADFHGGAIAILGSGSSAGSVQVSGSTFFNNSAEDGGAIAVAGISTNPSNVDNSTFVGNAASRDGGALNGSFAALRAFNSTFVDNRAMSGGATTWVVDLTANLVAYTSAVTISNSACEHGNTRVDNVSTDASCLDGNQTTVTEASLELGLFAPWGGLTPTYSIGSGSSAIDAVTVAYCSLTDQRGDSRSGSTCDAGSFEHSPMTGTLAATGTISMVTGRTITTPPNITKSGLTEPVVMRVATELTGQLPNGVTFSTSTGQFGGTPSAIFSAPWLVVSATDANGAIANARITIDNCVLTSNNGEFLVSNAIDLELFRNNVCGMGQNYRQTADIAWNGTWVSPATSPTPFSGTYDGGGHSITGLQISGGQTAFLPYTNGATISDLEIDVTATGSYATAGLVRFASNTLIDGVTVTGTITIPNNEGCHAGVAGETNNGTIIRNTSFVGDVIAPTSDWIGGLVGCAYADTTLEDSYFEGDVSGNGSVGGLIGWMDHSDIVNSYALGSVTSANTIAGGLVGWLDDDGTDADVTAISHSYSSMAIVGVAPIGALIGEGDSTAYSSTFWEGGLTGVSGLSAIGSVTDGAPAPTDVATSATAMKSFALFDNAGWAIVDGWVAAGSSADIWGICDGDRRPFLLWQHTTDACSASQPSPSTTIPSAPSTTIPSTPSTTTPNTTTPNTTSPTAPEIGNDPEVAVGAIVVHVNGQLVNSNVSWSGGNTLRGSVGSVNFSLTTGSTNGSPGTLTAGSSIALALDGLQSGSNVMGTIFSTPTNIGSFSVGSNGSLSANPTIPRSIAAGAHRLRLEMTAANGDDITVWLGVNVHVDPSSLPATGSDPMPKTQISLWLLILGGSVIIASRRGTRAERTPRQ